MSRPVEEDDEGIGRVAHDGDPYADQATVFGAAKILLRNLTKQARNARRRRRRKELRLV